MNKISSQNNNFEENIASYEDFNKDNYDINEMKNSSNHHLIMHA